MVYHIFLLIIILILFIFINSRLKTQENFNTYFLPFYNVESNLLRDFYKNDDYNKNFFKQKINYNKVYIFTNQYSYDFFKKFNSNLLEKSLIAESNLINLDSFSNNIKYLSIYNNSIANVTLPIILKDSRFKNNINLVSKLHNIYLLCLSKLKYNIFTIKDIPFNEKIGILNDKNSIYFY